MILKLTKNTFLAGMLIMMVACGGGGGTVDSGVSYSGSTSPATLTEANAGQLAGAALSNTGESGALMLSVTDNNNTSSGPTSSHSLTIARTMQDIVAHLEANPQIIAPVNFRAVTTQPETLIGECGGQVTMTFSGDPAAGSFSGSMNFSSYCNYGETVNGAVTISAQADANGLVTSMTMTFIRLTFTTVNESGTVIESATATGSVTFTASVSPAVLAGTLTVDMVMRDNVTTKTFWVNNYTISVIDYPSLGYEEVTITSGRFYHSDHGYVDIVTPIPLLINYADEYPYEGSFKITGQNSSALLTAIDPINYTLEIDIDRNGSIDVIQTGLWTEL
ncbi:MAG: hypothetical protein ABFS18_12265 [Thermodesulfobacteriota bacterium]